MSSRVVCMRSFKIVIQRLFEVGVFKDVHVLDNIGGKYFGFENKYPGNTTSKSSGISMETSLLKVFM